MSGHRQSALMLHGLGKTDQQWILAHLDSTDREIVSDHLTELKALGIPADRTFTAVPRPSTGKRDLLHIASANQMLNVLANEPVWLIRHVLALDNWHWRDAFLAALDPVERERLTAPGQAVAPLNDHAAASLRTQLLHRLGTVDSHKTQHQSRWNAIRGLLPSLQQRLHR